MLRNCLLLVCLTIGLLDVASGNLINTKVERTLDLSTQLVVETVRFTVLNQDTQNAVSQVVVAVPESLAKHVAHVTASSKSKTALPVKSGSNANQWTIQLPSNLKIAPQAESEQIQVQFVITQQLRPHPEQISQHDPQLVLYNGDSVWYSPYDTRVQHTHVRLPSVGSIESFSKPGQRQDRQILYGPFDNVEANSRRSLAVHFQTSSSMLLITQLKRTIQVSPWSSKVHFEDWIDVWHSGAALKDSFSRYEYQKDPTDSPAVIKVLRTRLPKSAQNIFYRDEIGNISTSALKPREQFLSAELKPRFPLFGGWRTHFRLGYSLPLEEVLSIQGQDQNVLRIPFFDRYHDDGLVILDANVRIYLPAGASDIQVQLPFDVKKAQLPNELFYLDVIGRPVIELKKQNLVSQHSQPITLKYKYNKVFLLQEPILLLLAFILFVVAIVTYIKIDFRIVRSSDKAHAQ